MENTRGSLRDVDDDSKGKRKEVGRSLLNKERGTVCHTEDSEGTVTEGLNKSRDRPSSGTST